MNLDAVGIVSKDITNSIKFYGLLGIKIKEEGGPGHYEGLTSSGLRIMLDSVDLIRQLNPDWKEAHGSGIILCFKQDTSKDVDELFKKITDQGYQSVKDPWDAFWGQRYASVKDPDGNQIDVFAQL